MSVLRPVGPLPARVYWVRRAAAAVGVVLVLLVASWAWGAVSGGDEGGADGATGPTTSPGVSESPSPSESGGPDPSESPETSPSPKPSASSTEPADGACAAEDVAVVVTPSKTTYTADQDPRFSIRVTNTSKASCKRDVGQKAMELRVSQGDTLIWSSDHCAPGGPTKVVTLKAGQSYTTSAVWSRSTSEKGCPTGQPDAPNGTYALTGRNLTVTSKPAAFALA